MKKNQNSEGVKIIHQNFKIVIIEDDDGLGKFIQLTLQREGFSSVLAATGEEALSKVQGESNEILLVDYKLPDMSGKQLVLKLQEKYGYTPNFITLTGFGDEKTAVEMMKLGSRDFIVKEQNFMELLPEVLKRVCADIKNEIKLQETEAELKKNLELLRETGEMARVGGWEIDLTTNKVNWTDTTKKIHEVSPDYLPDLSTALDFFPGDARKKIEKAVDKAIKKGEGYGLELPFVSAKGNKLWVVTKGNPQMENGKCVRLHGTFQDITERKKKEEKLKTANQQLTASEQQLMASNQQLAALNQQLISGEQQLQAANQQLAANEQQLRAANQQLAASEYELQKNYETLKKYLDVAAEIVVSLDENGNIKLLNESGHQILGYNPGELIGKNWFSVCLPETDRKDVKDFFLKLKNDGSEGSFNYENEIITKAGGGKNILWHNTIFRDDNGKFAGTLSSGEDITLRKQAEIEVKKARDEARESEERYRKAQEVGHIGSWEYNLQTNGYWGSDEGKRIYNLDLNEAEFLAEEVMELVVEKDRDKVARAMIDLVNENKPYDIIFEIIPKNTQEKKIIHSIAELQSDETGKPIKVTGVLHDITLQKTIEKQLIRSKEKAEEADRLKSAFLANMSHEIRTPMNGILGFTDLLRNPELSGEQQQKFIEIIQKSGNRMLETVNAIIDISKIETGQTELKMSTIDIKEEVESLYRFFSQETRQRGLELEIEELPLEKRHCLTDKYKFNSIFTNLIKNALKFTSEGSIKIGCKISDNRLHCYVKDTGIGIPEDRQHAIFNRFEQADIEDTNAYEGSGLGLAIAKAYAEMLGGEIGVQSQEGNGSTFWFNLPEQAEKFGKDTDENESEIPEKKIRGKLKVIIAEDDEISAEYLSLLLKNSAEKILIGSTGKETVEICKKNPDTDIVLMDIKMPQGNGYDSLAEIRKFNNNIKIIAQTANALTGDREKALKAGFDEYISKPIESKKLFNLLVKTLKEKKSKQKMDR